LDPGFLLPDLGDLLSLSCKSLFLLLKIAVRSWSPSPTLTPAMLIFKFCQKSVSIVWAKSVLRIW
jgi:hypothetical protein